MAPNKFATTLHRNTNKLTLILVYAFLEWVLIFLLLLNSLFSFFIIRFADYFGLKNPCLWCSRIDHFFEPSKFPNSCRSLVCHAYAAEISKLGYCSNHQKLAESQGMCEDCLSSAPGETSKKFAFFPWMNKLGVLQDKVSENGVAISKCSCCGGGLEKNSFSPDDFLIKPFWGDLENSRKGNLTLEDEIDDGKNKDVHSDGKRSGFPRDRYGEKECIDENRAGENRNREDKTEEKFSCSVSYEFFSDESDKANVVKVKVEESVKKHNETPSCEIQTQHLEFYIDQDACHLIPIELEEPKKNSNRNEIEEKNVGDEDFVMEFDKHVGTQYELILEGRSNLEEKVPLLPILECEEEAIIAELEKAELNKIDHFGGTLEDFEMEQFPIHSPSGYAENLQECLESAGDKMESHNNQDSEAAVEEQMDETEADISIGTEIACHDLIDDIPSEEIPPATSNANCCSMQDEEAEVEFRSLRVETNEPEMNNNLSFDTEHNEIEEEKVPDTPNSVEPGYHLHKKFLLLERRESGTEGSLDGSVTSDIESGGGVLTMEKLKSALKTERKALNALYLEFEEERSASAVAANQTMAMINRLQEEKAAMQMEALQYQRMMEEQSEYDQEALQLMNEFMVKRERERAELENELELYRKRVEDYETREKLVLLKRRKESSARSTATSSACFSNGEESDGLSVDLNQETKGENGLGLHQENSNQNTPVDAVVYLEDSMANFEEERLLIVDQLKVLEEKLFTLSEAKEDQENEESHLENGNGYNDNFEVNGKRDHNQEKRQIGAKAKRLLPFSDAIEGKNEVETANGHTQGEAEAEEVDSVMLLKSINKYEVETKKLQIEEEVRHVYERLRALEADKEFLKHCMTSLKRGDRGIQLLQEILQHLRDLRY